MGLTYRGQKGSALTIEELDGNFQYFTGSHAVSGSLTVSGSLVITGSLQADQSITVGAGSTINGDGEDLYLTPAPGGQLILQDSAQQAFVRLDQSIISLVPDNGTELAIFDFNPSGSMIFPNQTTTPEQVDGALMVLDGVLYFGSDGDWKQVALV
jgi:hypothetical protein